MFVELRQLQNQGQNTWCTNRLADWTVGAVVRLLGLWFGRRMLLQMPVGMLCVRFRPALTVM